MNETIKLLYAEDNPQDADLVCNHFLRYAPEFEITVADTGQACLAQLRADRFDLLLLDHRLSDMDGSDILRTLVRERIKIPVVLVTGFGDVNLVLQTLRLGAVTYIPKSGDYLETMPDILHGVLKEYLVSLNQADSASHPVRILYAEDSSSDADCTLQYFAERAPNFFVEVVRTGAEALPLLAQQQPYDLALIDLRLPDQNGLELVREAMRRGISLPPFIVISGKGEDTAVIAALRLGAVNYIVKQEDYLRQLLHTMDHTLAKQQLKLANRQLQDELAERKRIETELRENEARLHLALSELRIREEVILRQATHDELAGLPNRRLFFDRLTMAILEARRYDRKVAIVFVDLDHFKQINDTRGHLAGDKFLIAIAEQIKTVPREMDTCARLGGDEFALVLPNVDDQYQVGLVTDRLLKALGREFMIDGIAFPCTASIGAAFFPDDAGDGAALLKQADTAMYRAKQAGGNCCRFWSKDSVVVRRKKGSTLKEGA